MNRIEWNRIYCPANISVPAAYNKKKILTKDFRVEN